MPQEMTVKNYGKDITINIIPAELVDIIRYQSSIHVESIDEGGSKARIGYDEDYPNVAYSILGKNVVEIAEIEFEELTKRGMKSHSAFAANFFEPSAIQTVLVRIMGLGRMVSEANDDITANNAEAIKN